METLLKSKNFSSNERNYKNIFIVDCIFQIYIENKTTTIILLSLLSFLLSNIASLRNANIRLQKAKYKLCSNGFVKNNSVFKTEREYNHQTRSLIKVEWNILYTNRRNLNCTPCLLMIRLFVPHFFGLFRSKQFGLNSLNTVYLEI